MFLDRYRQLLFYAVWAVGAIGGLFIITRLIAQIRLWLPDRLYLQKATRVTTLTRAGIAADFAKFKSELYRLRYAEWLRDVAVPPHGPWHDIRPNIRDDAASTLLAQLDERWLGLDS